MEPEPEPVTCSGAAGKIRDSDERGEMHAGRVVHIPLRTVGHSPQMSRRTGGEKKPLRNNSDAQWVPAVTQGKTRT